MDMTTTAFKVLQTVITEADEGKGKRRSDSARVAGRVGGTARAKKLTPAERRAIAAKANKARWGQS